jgi:hypothetical protein
MTHMFKPLFSYAFSPNLSKIVPSARGGVGAINETHMQ